MNEFRDRLRTAFGRRLRDLRMYGSKVRGESHAESDIDLLVLIDGGDYAAAAKVWEIATRSAPGFPPTYSISTTITLRRFGRLASTRRCARSRYVCDAGRSRACDKRCRACR